MDCSKPSNGRAAATRTRRRKPEVDQVRLSVIRPSVENDKLYRPVDPSDPALIALAASIGERGILEPLVISADDFADDFIVSGHRRYAAAGMAGLDMGGDQ